MKPRTRQIVKLSFMIVLTFCFFLAELVGGHLTGSLALVSDSYHMISDVLSLIIGLSCVIISTRSSTRNTFGWARAEILGALINSVFLSALCFTILIEAVERLIHPPKVDDPDLLLIIGSLGLFVNLVGLALFWNETHSHGHSHANTTKFKQEMKNNENSHNSCHLKWGIIEKRWELSQENDIKKSFPFSFVENQNQSNSNSQPTPETIIDLNKKQKSKDRSTMSELSFDGHSEAGGRMNIKGVFLHILGDALGSFVVIVTAIVIKHNKEPWVNWIDPSLSIVMVSIIMTTTYPLLKESALILLQHVPEHIQISELAQQLSTEIEGVLGIHELHIWQLVGSRIIASLHVKCLNAQEYESLSLKIREFFHNHGIHSVTIQPEFVEVSELQSFT